MALLQINNKVGWRDRFKVVYGQVLNMTGISNVKTYYSALSELSENGYIQWQKGPNQYQAATFALPMLYQNLEEHGYSTGKAEDKHMEEQGKSTGNILKLNKPLKNKTQETIINKIDFVAFEFLDCFQRWLEYKKASGKPYKTEDSLRACYNKLLVDSGNNPEIAAKIVEQSIANNWAGLFPLKTNHQSSFNQKPTIGRATELINQAERLKELCRQNAA